MSNKTGPAESSAYLITHSDNPQLEVGKVLIDKGKRLRMEWNTINFETGDRTFTSGPRLLRLCPDCRNNHNMVGSLGHEGDCGSDEVREEARREIAHAKKKAERSHA